MSKLEDDFAENLRIASLDLNRPWPFGEPVREHHPDWCCEHPRGKHSGEGACLACIDEAMALMADPWPDQNGPAFHNFDHGRNWRIDFAWPAEKVAVEVEGIVYAKKGQSVGRHQTAAGFEADLEKYGWLQLNGWNVIRISRRQIKSGDALRLVEDALRRVAA